MGVAVQKSLSSSADPYAIAPGAITLKNKLKITDAIELNQCELVLSAFRRQQGMPSGNFDWGHLKQIHEHLFQDVYGWAGSARETGLKASDGRKYVEPASIDASMKAIFKELERDDFLLGSSESEFISKSAYYYNRMNLVHPFRTGNGRAIRTFIEGLAFNNGLTIDWKKIDRAQWQQASINAANGDRSGLKACFGAVVLASRMESRAKATPGLTTGQKNSAAEQVIKLVTRNIKSGKGLGASSMPDSTGDISNKSDDFGMS